MSTRLDTTELLSLDRRTGELYRIEDGGACTLLGTVRKDACRAIFDRLPYAPAWAPLAVEHRFPPVVGLAHGGELDELPEPLAGPVLAVIAHSVIKGGATVEAAP